MRKPTVHLNGTSGQDLFNQVMGVRRAVEAANAMLTEAWPNSRDYYVQGDGAYAEVRKEWEEHSRKLQAVAADMQAIALDIHDQHDQIDRRIK